MPETNEAALLIVPTEKETPDDFRGHEPTLDEFSKYRESGELPWRVTAAPKEKARDGGGRFTKILANWRDDSQFRQAVLDGAVEPTDNLDPETWRVARNAQIQRGAVKITAPQPEPEKVEATKPEGDEQKQGEQKQPIEEPLLPGDHPHFERAKRAEEWYPDLAAVVAAVPFGVSKGTGRAIAELDNSADVLYALAKNPELLASLETLTPSHRVEELGKLSNFIARRSATESAPKAAEKFTPPEPVGARQISKAFDVNDENMPADEWAKKRNEQIRKRQA